MAGSKKIQGKLAQFGYDHKSMDKQLLKWKRSVGDLQVMLENAAKKNKTK